MAASPELSSFERGPPCLLPIEAARELPSAVFGHASELRLLDQVLEPRLPRLVATVALLQAAALLCMDSPEAIALTLQRATALAQHVMVQANVLIHPQLRHVFDAKTPKLRQVQENNLVQSHLIELPIITLANSRAVISQKSSNSGPRAEWMPLNGQQSLQKHLPFAGDSVLHPLGPLQPTTTNVLVHQGEPIKHRQGVVGNPDSVQPAKVVFMSVTTI
eukprot:CAMPEP_0181466958 /NCGR_PEP_ID=MMETSP1110-20121109/36726_1 /TAXON_ID=174948 /ORGANISM="Symbiodinium sp., Strain CCMP421" /LENGTH=218 /DNA_ID=CAMNT_0023591759 /DNA_START=449 /DNA_END=1107 /DNA_ORIENTATION=-